MSASGKVNCTGRGLACIAIICAGLALPWSPAFAFQYPAIGNPQESEQYVSDNFGIESALPGAIAVTVLQTRDGYLWVGTQAGLIRFDGARSVPFQTANTLAFRNDSIRCLYEDSEGSLWIGTNAGVVRYQHGRFALIGLEKVAVTAIAQDRSGRMWIGTSGQGLNVWQDGRFNQYAIEPAIPGARVRCLYVDSSGRLWAGFDGGGVVCIENGKTRHDESDNQNKAMGDVLCICEQPRGTLWFGTLNHGLFCLKGRTFANFNSTGGLASARVSDLCPSQDGGLWVVDKLLQKISSRDGFSILTAPHLTAENIQSICVDHEGTVWLCAQEEGLIRMRRMPYRMISSADGLFEGGVRTVTQDASGDLWLAVQRQGIVRVSLPDGRVTLFDEKSGLAGNDPELVYVTSDQSVWFGLKRESVGKICVLRHNLCKVVSDQSLLCGAFEDRQHTLWLGTVDSGVFTVKDDQLSSVEFAPGRPIPHATSFCESADGTLYIGTWQDGLFKLKAGKFTAFNRGNGFPADDVRAIYVDKDGRVWVGFKRRGLAVLQEGSWRIVPADPDAAANSITAITEDNHGRLWLGTVAGVMWAEKSDLLAAARGEKSDPRLHSIGFHTPAVWLGAQPVVCKTTDGRLLFATHGGLMVVDPEHLRLNPIPPPVHIERITVDGKEIDSAKKITVPAGSRDIEIDYTALSFVQPEQVFFKYKLDGYDQDWVEAGTRRTASYTNLPPGKYAFQVRACNNDGLWNETGAQIAFIQKPYFYNTWSFYGAAVCGGLGLGLTLYRWRTAVLRRETEKLSRLVSERTQELELASTVKTEFLENVSHEIRNPLNGLNGLLEMLKQENLGSRAVELMDSMQACAKGLTRVFEEVLNHSNLEYGFIGLEEGPFFVRALLDEVAQSFAWQAAQNGCQIHLALPPGFIDGFIGDEKKIAVIAGNFIDNAVKYARGGTINLRAESHPAEGDRVDVHIEVVDQGPGIPADEQELIFRKFVRGANAKKSSMAGTGLGLATCRVLARALDGSVGVDSEPGKGAVFYLRVPLRPIADSPETERPLPAGGGPVLIVEDEHYNQIVLKGIAVELGYEPEVAGSAGQAEALLADREFNVIFLDWELPDRNGGEVARSVRARERGGRPVIIAMTAHDSSEIRRRCRDAGMDEFLRKPYSTEQVRRCIAGVLARRNGKPGVSEPVRQPVTAGHGLNLKAFQLYDLGAPDQAGQAAQHYIEALDQELAMMAQALETRNEDELGRRAHRVHALGGLIGAQALSNAAYELEMLPPHALPAERQRLFHFLTIAVATLKEQLKPARPDAVPPG